jgi:hypothetical protein
MEGKNCEAGTPQKHWGFGRGGGNLWLELFSEGWSNRPNPKPWSTLLFCHLDGGSGEKNISSCSQFVGDFLSMSNQFQTGVVKQAERFRGKSR